MKKAAIVSLYGNYNFGNKLQNYAVQELLKRNNFEVENIKNVTLLNNKKNMYINMFKYILSSIKKYVLYREKINLCLDVNDTNERRQAFLNFNKYINNSKGFFSFININKFTNFDYYFVGSDQIWNPNFGGLSDFDLLTFTNKKKIAFCASFGINYLPKYCKEKAKKYLSQFDAISVREDSGKKIIDDLNINKKVEVLVDPTMLLTVDDWNKVSNKPKTFKVEKFVLCYFLGNVSNKRKNTINDFAKKNNCKIIDMLDKSSEFYSCGPSEFIYLESKAFMIFTDSFHSTVFAILYNVPFVVFDREGKNNNMGGRITTLLNKFNLKDRYYNGQNLKDMVKCDYYNANLVLKKERKKSLNFIKNAIN